MAMAAAGGIDKPVVGTIAFHLGSKVQNESILHGYDQKEEDALLASVPWEQDGYRLFDTSVLAGSSREGWFVAPAESNALFLRKRHWRELGGYEVGFEAPGGGLANLNMWKRACEDPGGDLIMLLGEVTFHKVHGGIATNNPVSPWELFTPNT